MFQFWHKNILRGVGEWRGGIGRERRERDKEGRGAGERREGRGGKEREGERKGRKGAGDERSKERERGRGKDVKGVREKERRRAEGEKVDHKLKHRYMYLVSSLDIPQHFVVTHFLHVFHLLQPIGRLDSNKCL